MKLSYKFAIWFLAVTLVVLVAGGILSFYNIKEEVDQEQARYLKHRIDFITDEIKRGKPVDSLTSHKIDIRLLPARDEEIPLTVSDTMIWHHYLNRKEPEVKVFTSRVINDRHYYISTHDSLVESDDITEAVLKSLTGIFILFLVVTGLLSLLISKRLLAPFHKTLRTVQSFRLQQKTVPDLPKTHTEEFTRLNVFLNQMIRKAQQEYRNLKRSE